MMMLTAPAPQPELALRYQARAVHDASMLELGSFQTNAGPAYAIAWVEPASASGSATVPGSYIKADTGEFVVPEGARTAVIYRGRLKSISRLPWNQPVPERYDWTAPLNLQRRSLTPDDLYSPFIHGGAILFRPDPRAAGRDQFGHLCLLIPEWTEYLPPAFRAWRNEGGWSGGDRGGGFEARRLGDRLLHENPLIRILSFRRLLTSGRLTLSVAKGLLSQTRGFQRAVLVYLVLVARDVVNHRDLIGEVHRSVEDSADMDQLASIATGSYSAALFLSEDAAIKSAARELLVSILQRLRSMKTALRTSDALSLIFQEMGLVPAD